MCGIAGIIGSRLPEPELAASVERMRFALRHRGPDDEGLFLAPSRGVALAHTRLAILDLSAAGHQPMRSADGRYTIVFNGEIYNYAELRRELEANGESFVSHSDTEVILAAYRRYGPQCLHDFEGMFAFAIWDEIEQTAWLARDAFGIKPLYYSIQGESLIFASEVRALLASDLVSRQPCGESVFSYLLFGSVQEPLTLVNGVLALPAGHHLIWKAGKPQLRCYWEPQIIGEGISALNSVARVREALQESVQRHLISDVAVGVFLSGGIDSTVMATLAKSAGNSELQTFCITFDDVAFREGPVAARTAKHLGARHHEWKMDAKVGCPLLKEFLASSDQPSIDGFNTFCVSRFAREHGLRVVLSGLGGDELFGGYGSFEHVPSLIRHGQLASLIPGLPASIGALMQRFAPSPRLRRLGCFLGDRSAAATAYWCMRGIFTPSESKQLLQHYLGDASTSSEHEEEVRYFTVPRQPTLEDTVSYLELTRYMKNQLLRDSDVMSMASGLELRVPFVDRKLFEVLRQIPAATRLSSGKNLLLQAIPEIPDWIARAPKRGFSFPFESWLKEEWDEMFDRIRASSPVPLRTWYQCWCVHALEHALSRLGLR